MPYHYDALLTGLPWTQNLHCVIFNSDFTGQCKMIFSLLLLSTRFAWLCEITTSSFVANTLMLNGFEHADSKLKQNSSEKTFVAKEKFQVSSFAQRSPFHAPSSSHKTALQSRGRMWSIIYHGMIHIVRLWQCAHPLFKHTFIWNANFMISHKSGSFYL